MNVVFCPSSEIVNNLYERRLEEVARSIFGGKVESVLLHNADNLFDLVLDNDAVVYMEYRGKVTPKAAKAIEYAVGLGKPTYKMTIESIVKDDKEGK